LRCREIRFPFVFIPSERRNYRRIAGQIRSADFLLCP
jgi:hypothetical protein